MNLTDEQARTLAMIALETAPKCWGIGCRHLATKSVYLNSNHRHQRPSCDACVAGVGAILLEGHQRPSKIVARELDHAALVRQLSLFEVPAQEDAGQ